MARALKLVGELQASADTDFLLDIPNRRGFERELHRAIAYIKRYQASGALIVLDVDRLKPINDAFGHAAGDQVLKAIVAVLLRHVRSSDVIGRLGGDEFALLLWNLSETDARAKAASLEQAIDRLTFVFRGRNVTAGASAGVADPRPSCGSGQSAGRSRQRHVCAQGAAAARGVIGRSITQHPSSDGRPAFQRRSNIMTAKPIPFSLHDSGRRHR